MSKERPRECPACEEKLVEVPISNDSDADYVHPGSGRLIKATPIAKPTTPTYQVPAREVVPGMRRVW